MTNQCFDTDSVNWSSLFWIVANQAQTPGDELGTLAFWIKIIGPVFVTGGLALMALKVASSQRTIAANKYDMDLFEKRLSSYEEFKNQTNISIEEKRNRLDATDIINYDEISGSLKKCSFLFPRFAKNGVDGDIYILQKEISNYYEEVKNHRNAYEVYKRYLRESKNIDECYKKYTDSLSAASKFERKSSELIDNAIEYMESYLSIKHTPY